MKHVYFSFLSVVGIMSNNFFLEAHHFGRPSSVELFALPKRPGIMCMIGCVDRNWKIDRG